MDRSEGPRSARYRRRLYRGYLWIALIPFSFFVVLGGAAIFLSQNIVIRELSSLKERNLRQVAENIELWFSEADSIALGLSTDPELSRGAEYLLKTGIPSHSDLKLSRTLQSLLASAVNARLYLHSITVTTDSSAGYMITSTEGLIRLDDYSDSEWLRGTEDHMDEITPWTVARDFTPLPNFPLRIPILSFYRNMLGTGSLERKGVLSVNVDVRKLEALLEKSAEAAGGRFILVDRSNGKPLAGMKLGMGEESLETFLSGAGGDDYFVASLDSERFPFTYYLLSPAEEFRRIPRRITLIGGALATLALAVGIALALALARRNFRLLDGILDIVEAAGQGKPLPPFHESRNEALDYVSLAVLKTFVEHDYYKIRLSERELRQRTLELTALQAQMNPHFLFNTLTTIAFKAMQLTGGKNDLSDMVKQLSDMLAYSLADARVPATLGAEFAHARRYAELQKRRFGARFDCEWSEDPGLSGLPCIKLIVQPLVENAFEHGFSGKERGGVIRVGASRDQGLGRVRLVVEDDGTGMAKERLEEVRALIAAGAESAEHVGLVNTARRLTLAYGAEANCAVESWPGRGTRITLLFPDTIPAAACPVSPEGIPSRREI
jgi:two-component system sensor histidine kinase YesM